MLPQDTSIGGPQRGFPQTTWATLSELRTPSAGLDTLCRKYWKAVYRYLRIARGRKNETA